MNIKKRVRELMREAERRCEGCRATWRLDGWKHRAPFAGVECQAKEQRQELRDIAREVRK